MAIGIPLYSTGAPYRSVNARGQAAIADVDYANGRYFHNGLYYYDEATLNTAMGATKSGITRVMGSTTPFTGFNQSELSGYITATTAASGSGTETVLQLDDGSESNRIRLEYDWSVNTLYSYITIGGSSTKSNLGALAASTAITASFSASSGKLGFCATKSGGYTKYSAIASLPTFSKLRIGRSFTGNTWTGTISRWAIYADRDAWGNAIMREGDSYTGGSTGYGSALSALGRTFSSHGGGLGGSIPPDNTANNPADIGEVARMIAYDDFFDNTIVFCDGNAPGGTINSTSSSQSDIDLYDRQIWSGLRSYRNVVLVTPAILPSSLGIAQNFNNAIRNLFLSKYASITVDQMAVCGPVNAGPEYDISAMDPNSTGHLSDANKAVLASAINDHLIGRGL